MHCLFKDTAWFVELEDQTLEGQFLEDIEKKLEYLLVTKGNGAVKWNPFT